MLGKTKTKARTQILENVASGKCQVLIGTHALNSDKVTFQNLGLIVIDEEQRFGVIHKELIKSRNTGIDVLSMSATPIPRTLQLSLSGFRDMSLMNSPPPGRKEVDVMQGFITPEILKEGIEREKARGGQVFIVVPMIKLMQNVTEILEKIGIDVENDVLTAYSTHEELEKNVERFLNKEVSY